MKNKKYHTVRAVPKSNRQTVERTCRFSEMMRSCNGFLHVSKIRTLTYNRASSEIRTLTYNRASSVIIMSAIIVTIMHNIFNLPEQNMSHV